MKRRRVIEPVRREDQISDPHPVPPADTELGEGVVAGRGVEADIRRKALESRAPAAPLLNGATRGMLEPMAGELDRAVETSDQKDFRDAAVRRPRRRANLPLMDAALQTRRRANSQGSPPLP